MSCSLREDISRLSKLTLLLSPYYTLFVHAMDGTGIIWTGLALFAHAMDGTGGTDRDGGGFSKTQIFWMSQTRETYVHVTCQIVRLKTTSKFSFERLVRLGPPSLEITYTCI